ncbi:MAG: ABC transporter permease [Desulfocapsa sp.]|nr:ABC transporter permease [Desulfocapsa sp.]MBN4045882.1 ABC transporter permease [bacterium AH-315-P11]
MGEVVPILRTHLFRGIAVGLVVASLSFIVVHLTKGDTALEIAIARYNIDITNESLVEQIRVEEKLDQSLLIQYGRWIGHTFTFDFGHSLVSNEKVTNLLWYHFRYTLILSATAMLISLVIALPLGIVCGMHPGSVLDNISGLMSSALVAVPHFITGVLLILVFAIQLQWFPVAGFFTPSHLLLPAVTLGIGLAAFSNRVIATAIVNVRSAAFYQFARMKGLTESRVLLHHGIKNASIPVITYIGLQTAHLLDGVLVVETLFAWPGIGKLILDSILARDIPVIQGASLFIGLVYVFINATVDLICIALDPCRNTTETSQWE